MWRRNVLRLVVLMVFAISLLVGCRTAFPLSLTSVGEGHVSVANVPRALPWQGDFARGAVVRLEALPADDHDFVRWEGGLSGATNPTHVTMNGPTVITAVFAASSALDVSPAQVDFGEVALGSSSSAVFSLTNAGAELITGSAVVDAPFAIVPPASYTLAPAESATITVSFTPSALGTATSAVAFSGRGGTIRPVRGSGVEPGESDLVTLEPSTALLAPEASLVLALAPTAAVPADLHWRATAGQLDVDGTTATYTAPATAGTQRVWVTSASDPAFAATAWIVVEPAATGFVGRRVAIVGDEVLLRAYGATAQLKAVVFEDGAPLEGAVVNWVSSEPTSVSVTQDGLVTAMTDVGSATVKASFGTASDRRLVPVAQVADATRVIERDAVLELRVTGDDLEAVVLERSADTEGLVAGNVIISSAGILARVLSSRVLAQEVVLEVEAATLDEAFDRVSFGGTSEILELDVTLTGDGVSVTSRDAAFVSPQAYELASLECGLTVGRLVDITITGGSVDFTRRIAFTARYEKPWAWSPPTLLLQADVHARTDIASPVVAIAPGFEGTYACELDITAILVPIVSFFGIVNVGGNLTPKVGFEISGSVDGARLEISGPSIEGSGYDATLGYRYEDDRSTLIRTVTFEEGTRRLGSFDLDGGPTFGVSMGPYLALGLGTTIDVTTIKGVGVDVATPKLYAQLNLEVAPPFDVTHPAYRGPSWNAELGGAVEFGLKLTGNVAKVMKTFGVTVELAKVSFPLFDPLELFASPRLPVTVDREVVRNSAAFGVTGLPSSYDGLAVRFFALPHAGGDAIEVAVGAVDADGAAEAIWRPGPQHDGGYDVFAAVSGPLFAAVDYPYVSTTSERAAVAVQVPDLPIGGWVAPRLAAGSGTFTLALADTGDLYGWGMNDAGQVGDTTTTPRLTPQWSSFFLGTAVDRVAAGSTHALALTNDGDVYAFGSNRSGQLGDGTDIDRPTPVRVDGFPAGTVITGLAAGWSHSLAWTGQGDLYAWGSNSSGQLGDGSQESRSAPVRVSTLPTGTRIVQAAGGGSSTLALTDEGVLYAWGWNGTGRLGIDAPENAAVSTPERVVGFEDDERVAWIAAEFGRALAITTRGRLYGWGGDYNASSQNLFVATAVAGLSSETVFVGGDVSHLRWYALDETGRLHRCSLDMTCVELANALPPDAPPIAEVATHSSTLLVRTEDGDVWASGSNSGHRVGAGSNERYDRPALVLRDRSAMAILTVQSPWGATLSSHDGRIDCAPGNTCSATYSFNGAGSSVPYSVLTLTPVTASWGSYVVGERPWTGFCDATVGPECVLNMVDDRQVGAVVTDPRITNNLTVSVLGSGTVTSSDGRISCRAGGGTCTAGYTYVDGSPAPWVTLTATPDPNNDFTRWTGACSGTDPSCMLAMSWHRSVTASFADERDRQLTVCDVWSAAQSGGYGTTVDTWDVSMIPSGATFDIRFDAYSLPDKFVVEYPNGVTALDTGWRGSASWDTDPRYPGGIAGPGKGQVDDVFTRGVQDWFRVSVSGPDPNTAWEYEIRCRR